MLWYPAYENLFSIIRKKFNKKSATKADKTHLHQLLYIFLENKLFLISKDHKYINGIIIVFFNLLILIVVLNI